MGIIAGFGELVVGVFINKGSSEGVIGKACGNGECCFFWGGDFGVFYVTGFVSNGVIGVGCGVS